jgi:hypothetical protein
MFQNIRRNNQIFTFRPRCGDVSFYIGPAKRLYTAVLKMAYGVKIVKRLTGSRSMKQKGLLLEKRVARIYKMMGEKNIKQNVMLRDMNGNRSEIDVVFGYVSFVNNIATKS